MTPFDFLLKWGPKDHDAMRDFFGDLGALLRDAEARERRRLTDDPKAHVAYCGVPQCAICSPIIAPR